jgi:hypothetical protein
VLIQKTVPTETVTVEVEDVPGGQRLTYAYSTETTVIWTVKGTATPELAAALVKDYCCRQGRCPLKPLTVTLKPKRKID